MNGNLLHSKTFCAVAFLISTASAYILCFFRHWWHAYVSAGTFTEEYGWIGAYGFNNHAFYNFRFPLNSRTKSYIQCCDVRATRQSFICYGYNEIVQQTRISDRFRTVNECIALDVQLQYDPAGFDVVYTSYSRDLCLKM